MSQTPLQSQKINQTCDSFQYWGHEDSRGPTHSSRKHELLGFSDTGSRKYMNYWGFLAYPISSTAWIPHAAQAHPPYTSACTSHEHIHPIRAPAHRMGMHAPREHLHAARTSAQRMVIRTPCRHACSTRALACCASMRIPHGHLHAECALAFRVGAHTARAD